MTGKQANPFAMSPDEFVDALYHTCFGRTADPAGMEYWTTRIRASGDPTCLLRAILDSPEYAARSGLHSQLDCTAQAEAALESLSRPVYIVDVGAQSLGTGLHAYDPLVKTCEVRIIGFDPLEERLRERAEAETTAGLELLPYAVGDGQTHTLYVNNDDATSSLFRLNESHNRCFNHLNELRTVSATQVETRCLDDVLPERPVDFLKLDVQGAELMVLQSASRTLSRTAVVHCEVEFSQIYQDQPLFSDVSQWLSSRSFMLIDILVPARYYYLTASGHMTEDRLLWADAVFFRESDDPETLAVQALIAATVYRKPTLAEHLLASCCRS